MFYIQKNDKPNIIEKNFNIIKMQENKLFLPITAKTSEKQIEKLAQKTKKIISRRTYIHKLFEFIWIRHFRWKMALRNISYRYNQIHNRKEKNQKRGNNNINFNKWLNRNRTRKYQDTSRKL